MVVLIGSCSRNVFDSSDILVALSLFMLFNRAKKIAHRSGDDCKATSTLNNQSSIKEMCSNIFAEKTGPCGFFLISDHLP